jgi:signal peptidase I
MRRSDRLGGLRRAFGAALHLLGGIRVAVVGRSMEPALREGDHLLVSRLAYRLGRPRRGEIVFLRPRTGGADRVECIKRVIGLPHERIAITGAGVVVGGRPLPEPYVAPRLPPLRDEYGTPGSPTRQQGEWQLGAGEYFVLGDNRGQSTDSRQFGPVSRRDLVGRAWYRYAPPARRGRIERPAADVGSTAGR